MPEIATLTCRLLESAANNTTSSLNVQYLATLLSAGEIPKGRFPKDIAYLSELCAGVEERGCLEKVRLEAKRLNSARVTRSQTSYLEKSISQASAKLSCLYGIPSSVTSGEWGGLSLKQLHANARAIIYNMNNYHFMNDWGPFKNDGSGSVDWEKLEAILYQLLLRALDGPSAEQNAGQDMVRVWSIPFAGAAPNSFKSPTLPMNIESLSPYDRDDPYGVTGTWDRIVCFLDYGEFYYFNFFNQSTLRPEPQVAIDTEEALIMIRMRLQVTAIEAPWKTDGQHLPVVQFQGFSSLLPPFGDANNGSAIRGGFYCLFDGESTNPCQGR